MLIGRRRFLSLHSKGEKEIPAVITKLKGPGAEAASLFENLIRKDLSPLEKASMVKKLVELTKSGITCVSKKYGLPKSTISEWSSILSLPGQLQERMENGEGALYEGIKIARQSSEIQDKLAKMSSPELEEELIELGIKRGAPKGLLTIRLVFNPAKEEERAKDIDLDVNDLVKELILNYLKTK
jgi:ParB family chromosome partitioning protein